MRLDTLTGAFLGYSYWVDNGQNVAIPGGILSLDISPIAPNVMWASSATVGPAVSRDGRAWQLRHMSGRVIAASQHDGAGAFLAGGADRRIFQTADYGETWSGIVAGIADIQEIREDPTRRNVLIIGAADGIYLYNGQP